MFKIARFCVRLCFIQNSIQGQLLLLLIVLRYLIKKGYYMGAHASLNLFNKFGKEIKCDKIQALFYFC